MVIVLDGGFERTYLVISDTGWPDSYRSSARNAAPIPIAAADTALGDLETASAGLLLEGCQAL